MSGFALDPRLAADSIEVLELPLCALRLMDDARWPWLLLVPRLRDARELVDLERERRLQLVDEVDAAARVLRRLFAPDKLNVAALGNVVPQLHVHVIARHHGDPAWPRPVWGVGERQPYPGDVRSERIASLRAGLSR